MESLRKEIAAERGGDSPKFHHVVVNLTELRASGDADNAYFEVAKAAIEEVGMKVFGGTLIHHSYSGSQEGEDDLDKWKERQFSGRDWEGDVRDELEVDHHIHALVLADSIDHLSCQNLFDRTGILVHRVENRDEDTNVSLYGVEDLAEADTYALSHARESDEADAYRYFGRVANHSADHRIEARCKEVVRSVVPKTLDLTPSNLVCDRELATDLYDHAPNLSGYDYDTDDGDEDGEDSEEGDDTDEEQQELDDVESDDQDGSDDADDGSDEGGEQADDTGESDDQDGDDSEDSGDSGDDADADTDSSDSETDTAVHCNGRLVPMEYAPSWLEDDDRELEHADELREAYENWDPPDQRDLDSFGSSETG
jgi:hypothetical protein